MGIPFHSSEASMTKPNPNQDPNNSYISEPSNLDMSGSQIVETIHPPKSTDPELHFKSVDISTVEVISLPPETIKPKRKSSAKEFIRQLIGTIPGEYSFYYVRISPMPTIVYESSGISSSRSFETSSTLQKYFKVNKGFNETKVMCVNVYRNLKMMQTGLKAN